MSKPTIVTMPGDGIGNQVLPEAIRVLNAVGFDAEYIHADIGWECWINEGNALPERTVGLLARHKLGLFGAITSKPKREADAELKPALRGKGYTYYSPIVTMRQRFGLDVCLRPCIGFPGNPLNFIRKSRAEATKNPRSMLSYSARTPRACTREWSGPTRRSRCARPLQPTPSSTRFRM